MSFIILNSDKVKELTEKRLTLIKTRREEKAREAFEILRRRAGDTISLFVKQKHDETEEELTKRISSYGLSSWEYTHDLFLSRGKDLWEKEEEVCQQLLNASRFVKEIHVSIEHFDLIS